jgi:hypothetical protein
MSVLSKQSENLEMVITFIMELLYVKAGYSHAYRAITYVTPVRLISWQTQILHSHKTQLYELQTIYAWQRINNSKYKQTFGTQNVRILSIKKFKWNGELIMETKKHLLPTPPTRGTGLFLEHFSALYFSTTVTSYVLAYEDGTDRMFQNVGI